MSMDEVFSNPHVLHTLLRYNYVYCWGEGGGGERRKREISQVIGPDYVCGPFYNRNISKTIEKTVNDGSCDRKALYFCLQPSQST